MVIDCEGCGFTYLRDVAEAAELKESNSMDDVATIEEIRRLKARYFRFLDLKDWEAWGQVFTEDATLKADRSAPHTGLPVKATPKLVGRAEIVAFVQESVGAAVTVHHGHMPEIEILSQTTARGVWAMEDIVERTDRVMHGHGHYHETYTREGGVWRISSLRLTRLRISSLPRSH